MRELSNRAVSGIPRDLLIVLLVLACSGFAFGLGILAGKELSQRQGGGFDIQESPQAALHNQEAAAVLAPAVTEKASVESAQSGSMPYVGSRSGEVYYLSTCKSAARIKSENRVFFATEADAKAAGRRPASNCPGL